MPSVITVADEILKIAKAEGVALTPLQLMKLVYISYGWYSAMKGAPLFPETIEAWKYGPVIPELYRATKQFGRTSIPFEMIGDGVSTDSETHAFLADVVSKYGRLSGFALSQMTHKTGTPWRQVYEDGVFNIEIPPSIIKAHYLELLNDRRRRTAAA